MVLRQCAVSFALLMLGFGCKGSAPVSSVQDAAIPSDAPVADAPQPDAGSQIPQGWKVYENKQLGVTIAYPSMWYYREDAQQDRTLTFFADAPIEERPESDVTYPIDLVVRNASMQDSITELASESQTAVTVGQYSGVAVRYMSDLLDQVFVAYVFEVNSRTYVFSTLESGPVRPIFDAMLQTISLGGK